MRARTVGGRLAFAARMHEEDLVLVTLSGPLDTYTVPGFRRGVEPHAGADHQIVIDLSEVTLIDSAGLRALVTLHNRSSQRDAPARRPLGLICPHRHVRRVLEITGLHGTFILGTDLVAVRIGLARCGGAMSSRYPGARPAPRLPADAVDRASALMR